MLSLLLVNFEINFWFALAGRMLGGLLSMKHCIPCFQIYAEFLLPGFSKFHLPCIKIFGISDGDFHDNSLKFENAGDVRVPGEWGWMR